MDRAKKVPLVLLYTYCQGRKLEGSVSTRSKLNAVRHETNGFGGDFEETKQRGCGMKESRRFTNTRPVLEVSAVGRSMSMVVNNNRGDVAEGGG